VYNLMRCPGPPRHLGPHCWRDPVGREHYKLKSHHLGSLIKYIGQGATLQTHDDVPEDIRQQLYAEEQQRFDRKQTSTAMSPLSMPPINITNVLPGYSEPTPLPASQPGTASSMQPPHSMIASRLDVPGLRDVAVKDYSDWQQAQVHNESLKIEFRKARDVVLPDGLDKPVAISGVARAFGEFLGPVSPDKYLAGI
jgi:hypothetical protein